MDNVFANAKWIWLDDCHTENTYVDFREILTAVQGKKYTMYISADSNYALYINDRFVESGQYADYPDYKVYDELDITDYLIDGENDILVTGYWQGKDFSTYRKEAAGIIYSIYEDGKPVLSSGSETLAHKNIFYKSEGVPNVSAQLGSAFDYNACCESIETVLDNADVQNKQVTFVKRPIKKLAIHPRKEAKLIAWGEIKDGAAYNNVGERMQNAYMAHRYNPTKRPLPCADGYELTASDPDSDGIYIIVDLGEECVGYTDIELDVPYACDIIMGHGEHLEDLRVRAFIGGRVFANRYGAKAGHNEYLNPFRRMGLRYMQLNIYAKSVRINYAGIRPTVYEVDHSPYFKCSDKLHSRIYDVCINTLVHCMHDHYEDCPWREQALYAMDSRNQMLCGYYCFGEYDFAKSSIRLIAKSIRDDNLLELCSPGRVPITIPSFCAIFVTQVYEYVIHSGDLDFGREMLDTVKRVTDEFIYRMGENGLIKALPEKQYWNFYEWQKGLNNGYGIPNPDDITYDAPLNAFVSMALRSLSQLYTMLGDSASSDYYSGISVKINEAIEREFWCAENKAYYTYINVKSGAKSHFGQLTQALVVCCGACGDDRLDDVLDTIARCDMYEATLSYSIFVYDALMKRADKYARFVLDDIADKWGHMLYNNATTFWETIDGADAFANAGSLCHGWSAVPAYVYYRYAAGIKAVDGKLGEYTVEPVDCGLYECKAYIKTPNGEIKYNI